MWTSILAIVAWFISLFRPSNDIKLGKLEEANAEQDKVLKEVSDANDTKALLAKLSDAGIRMQLSKFKRD